MTSRPVERLRAVASPDTLPFSQDPTGPCPNCGRVSSFEVGREVPVGDGEHAVHLMCQGCGCGCIVIEAESVSENWIIREPLHWWPVPGAAQLDPAVPANVAAAYDEGMRCLAVQAPRAAAVMLRSMLAFIVTDKGSEEAKRKRGLKARLEQMAREGTLHPSLAGWATTIKDLGNGGAHPDELPEPSQAEAEELGRLCRRVIELVYEIEARIQRARNSESVPDGGAPHPIQH